MPLCLLQLKSTATLPSQLIELPVSFLINFIYCVHPRASIVISPVFWVSLLWQQYPFTENRGLVTSRLHKWLAAMSFTFQNQGHVIFKSAAEIIFLCHTVFTPGIHVEATVLSNLGTCVCKWLKMLLYDDNQLKSPMGNSSISPPSWKSATLPCKMQSGYQLEMYFLSWQTATANYKK